MASHGTPDWADERSKKTVYGGIDLAEHASRLGWPGSFDGRGDVIWFDGFEEGIGKWLPVYVGVAGTVLISNTTSKNGMFSLQVRASANAGAFTHAEHDMAYQVEGPLGLEFSLATDEASYIMEALWNLRGRTAGLRAGLRYQLAAGKLWYYNNAGGWTLLDDDLWLYPGTRLFHPFKLVVDSLTGKYKRLLIEQHTYDLKNIEAYPRAASNQTWMEIKLGDVGQAVPHQYLWYDDVIVTQNEP